MKPTIAFYRLAGGSRSAQTIERMSGLISTEITIHETPHHEWLVMAAPGTQVSVRGATKLNGGPNGT